MRKILYVAPLILSLTYCASCSFFESGQKEDNRITQPIVNFLSQCKHTIKIENEIPDQYVNHRLGNNLDIQLDLGQGEETQLYWTKDYGPDGVTVNPTNGCINWDIEDDMPSESFHVGLNVYSGETQTKYNFIIHAGIDKDQVITVGTSGDYQTIKEGLVALESGGTLVVLNGEYSGESNFMGLTLGGAVQHPPSGDAEQFTTIMAKNPGQVILKEGAYVRLHGNWPVSYVAIKGFYVIGGQMAAFGSGKDKEESSLRNHHLKFINNGVYADTNADNTKSPFNAFRSDDILFENNYAFGGGRYKFTSYQAENIVWRRNVARYDVGTYHNEPKGTYSVYTTKNAFLGNNIAVDAKSEFVNQGELAGEFTTPTTSGDTIAEFHRNMQINSEILFGNMDEQISGGGGDSVVLHRDIVSWDVRPYGRYVMSWGSAWFDHMTMGNVIPENFAQTMFNGYHDNARGLTNSTLHSFQNGDMFEGFAAETKNEVGGRSFKRFGVDTVNMTEIDGNYNVLGSTVDNVSEISPLTEAGGLKYLTRIEPYSDLSGVANDGGDLGATVMTFIGKSGTLYGEDGFDSETYIPMWPFPMEDLIKEKFSQLDHSGPTFEGHYTARSQTGTGTLSGERGFAIVGEGLSNYIWGYLGNHVPPLNVSASSNGEEILVQWAPLPETSQANVIKYKIWSYDEDTEKETEVGEVSGDTFRFVLSDHGNENVRYGVSSQTSTQESSIAYLVKVLRYQNEE